MKSPKERKRTGFFIKIISFFIFISIILVPFSALAVNMDLVDNEINWLSYSYNQFDYTNSSYFQGFSKYILDEDEGCFYFLLSFKDFRIDPKSSENIALSFTVKNDVNTYKFQIDESGLLDSSNKNSLNAIEVYYNFDEAFCAKQGGVIYAAFKLKNSTDRKLNNKISCEYFCGYDCNYNLFNGVNLDMYVPATTKESKSTTSKTTTKKSNTQSNGNPTTTKSVKESSQKFAGTGRVSTTARNSTTKFSGSQETTQAPDSQIVASDDNSYFETMLDTAQSDVQEANTLSARLSMSQPAKLLLIIFAVLFSLGIACVFIGVLNGKKNDKEQG